MEQEDKNIRGQTPAEERADIGTPAGEEPSRGRQRHGTECPGECRPDEVQSRKTVEDAADISDEEFAIDGHEISTTGGITGTRVRGGRTPGGTTEGGTAGPPPIRGKPAEGDR